MKVLFTAWCPISLHFCPCWHCASFGPKAMLVFWQYVVWFKIICSLFTDNHLQQLRGGCQSTNRPVIFHFSIAPLFEYGETIASFQESGNTPLWMERLMISVRGLTIVFIPADNNSWESLSDPQLFFFFIFRSALATFCCITVHLWM